MKHKLISLLLLGLCLTACNKTEATTHQVETQPVENIKETELSFTLSDGTELNIPYYSEDAYTYINDGIPYFSESEITTEPFEIYSDLDDLGRCGVAYANICKELMPTEKRESISNVKPSGWQSIKYDFVDGKYLYNRCHLIGYQLAGENANEKNLITGTRALNIDGMLPFENLIADYIDENPENHVMYRVTPLFEDNNLVANGVLMEGHSVEDNGSGVEFNIFAYNNQPGVTIDYKTGLSVEGNTIETESAKETENSTESYVLNTKTKKIHKSDCKSVKKIQAVNKKETDKSLDELINEGYTKCKICFKD